MANKNIQRTPSGDRRRQSMMDAAWKLFMKKGYAAVSLDEIIRNAGGSKSSIYEFFGNKEGLFYAIVEDVTAKIVADIRLPDTEGMTTRAALRRIGYALGRDILSEHGIGLYWLSVSISRRFPNVSRMFYDSGPRTAQRIFADFLAKEARRGQLNIKDPQRASEIFFAMVLEYVHMAMSLNVRTAPSDKELKHIVDEAVDLFLKAYGA